MYFIYLFLDGATNNSNAINSHINNNNTNKSYSSNKQKSPDIPPALPQNNFSNIQNELKKQLASDSRNRGPPPPAPIRNVSKIRFYLETNFFEYVTIRGPFF